MSIDSLVLGGLTFIFWKRRSKAPSFSIYFLYSSIVVAPIQCMSPLAREGLNIFDASNEPEAPPAPTIVCSSSMNIIMSSLVSSSSITLFKRSSNCPLYFVPATIEARSSDSILFSWSILGTVFRNILWASPSIIAVLPTPGSPINTGLFFFLLVKIWATLSISLSRPITGSNFPFFANCVISLEKWSNVGVVLFFDVSFCTVESESRSLLSLELIKSLTVS